MSHEQGAVQLAKLADELNRLSALLGESGNWSLYVTQSINCNEGYQIALTDSGYEVKSISRLVIENVRVALPEDELLYEAMLPIVESIARRKSQQHQKPFEDPRREMDRLELELFGKLNPAWGTRRAAQQKKTQERFPYDDPVPGEQLMDSAEYYYISEELQRIQGRATK